jgi:hypothetical protein
MQAKHVLHQANEASTPRTRVFGGGLFIGSTLQRQGTIEELPQTSEVISKISACETKMVIHNTTSNHGEQTSHDHRSIEHERQ